LITKSVQAKFERYPILKTGILLPLKEPVKFIWEDSIELLEERFRDEKYKWRSEIEKCMELLGAYGVHLMVQILMDSKNKVVRTSAVNSLMNMGDLALNEITSILKNPSNPWYLYRNALSVISKIGGAKEIDLVSGFLRHSKPRVREEALSTITLLQGPAVEPVLLRAMRDPNLRVRRRAVECIGKFPLKSQKVLFALLNILELDENSGKSVIDRNQLVEFKVEAINTLSLIGNIKTSDDKRIEDLFLELIMPDKKWLNKLSKKVKHAAGKKEEDDAIKSAALKALWKMGTSRVLPGLNVIAEKGDRSLTSKAKEAIAQIKTREKGQNR
jgi:HEAT repeat protein